MAKKREIRYENNPFLSDLSIPKRNKNIQISAMGKDDNILVNQKSGEVLGGTHVVLRKSVDTQQFIKLFAHNIAMTFDLTRAGIKALNVLIWTIKNIKPNTDWIDLEQFSLQEFLDNQTEKLDFSLPTFWRGLAELEKANIIAKSMKKGRYFFNPNFCFNGDRIAFTTMLERDPQLDKINKERQALEAAGQQKMDL